MHDRWKITENETLNRQWRDQASDIRKHNKDMWEAIVGKPVYSHRYKDFAASLELKDIEETIRLDQFCARKK